MREEIDIRLPRLMDSGLNEKARLRTAKVGYALNNTPLSTATLTMSRGEATATVGDFVELYETYGSIGIFRVTDVETVYTPGLWARLLQSVGLKDVKVNLTLKHALCTIEDGCVFGYHEYGGTGVKLQSVLENLMAFQPVARWQLGSVDFETEFQYSFENESNLLDAILSTAEPLTGEHVWICDFTTTPWTLGLAAARTDDVCEMRMNRNISTVKVEVDRSTLCTRLYPLGYGEGVNQLTIADVNGGVKYLDDAEAQAAWGIVAQPYVDTTITSAATLKAVSQAKLDILKNPTITVTVTGIDLSSLTGELLDRLYPGRMCRVPLPDYGITVNERIISVKKDDVYGGNTRATITLANQKADAVNDIANLVRKAQINELYSQGATNQYALQFADNADSSHPAELSFYIDKNAVHINSVMCRYKLQAFRGYSKGAKSGGASTSSATSESGGYSSGVKYTSNKLDSDTHAAALYTEAPNQTTFDGHKHVDEHVHSLTVTTPSHTHNVSLSIAAHTHDPILGIYTGETADSVMVEVDGNTVPPSAIDDGEFDAVSYLDKDSDGKITRGTWHRVTFTPNKNTRIVADLHVQTFIRSVLGDIY